MKDNIDNIKESWKSIYSKISLGPCNKLLLRHRDCLKDLQSGEGADKTKVVECSKIFEMYNKCNNNKIKEYLDINLLKFR